MNGAWISVDEGVEFYDYIKKKVKENLN
jgi:hypothetical protein